MGVTRFPELLAIPEPLLKVGHYVWFSKGWPRELEDKVFKITVVQQIPRMIHRIITSGSTISINLEDEGLFPEEPASLYEILFGFKGVNIILYPFWPSTDPYLKLEKSGYRPDTTSDDLRYLGGYLEEETPWTRPLLREYCVNKDWMPDLVYQIYNDDPQTQHFALKGTVNRCKIEEVYGDEKRRVIAERRYRFIPHYTIMVW